MTDHIPHIVIIGGGFGGLYAAKQLKRVKARVTLVDKRNFHLFQPLLYQVATGGLSPGDIASPIRAVLKKYPHVSVLKDEVRGIEPDKKRLILKGGELSYDYLIVATGVRHHYFGNSPWGSHAPGLKTIEDALEMRRRILNAFEEAEKLDDPELRAELKRFVIVGAGPTGVELAGALAELAHATMHRNFRNIDPSRVDIVLVEGTDRVLPPYPPDLSAKAQNALEKLGVKIMTKTFVTDIQDRNVRLKRADGSEETLRAATVLWAAGVKANRFGEALAAKTGAEADRSGRIAVQPDLSLPGYDHILVVGDLAQIIQPNGKQVPGVAPAAMQMGRYAASRVRDMIAGRPSKPFTYFDKGSLAVIGRNAAVADLNVLKLSGLPAWLIWAFIHIHFLIEFGNKMIVSTQWAWNYLTRKRGARLITGKFTPEEDGG